jgi:glutathione S-transferase
MKLLGSVTSPFVRKVRVLALELGLDLTLESVSTATSEALPIANPLAKIPTLVRDDGPAIFDSPVVCEFINAHVGGALVPASGEARWRALTLEALADGLCDAAVWRRGEMTRPDGDGHPDALAKQARLMQRALDALEAQAETFTGFGVGEIAAACALAYLDFRFPTEPWRISRPRLADWFETIGARPSMRATEPSA